jgi:hypothetical protein
MCRWYQYRDATTATAHSKMKEFGAFASYIEKYEKREML